MKPTDGSLHKDNAPHHSAEDMARMSTTAGSRPFDKVALGLNVFAILAVVLLLFKYDGSQRALRAISQELGKMQTGARIASLEHGALIHAINGQGWKGAFLLGRLATSGSPISVEPVQDGIYYIISSTCGACPSNYPAIKRLSHQAPGRVLIVALDDSTVDLRSYASKFALELPLVGSASGRLMQNLPTYATPITLLFRKGRLATLITGKVDERAESLLLTNVRDLKVQ